MANSTSFATPRQDRENVGNAYCGNGRSDPTEKADSSSKPRQNLNKKITELKNVRKFGPNNNITVVRSNKLDLNPRSVYNKIDEFHALVEEEEADVISCQKVGKEKVKPLIKS